MPGAAHNRRRGGDAESDMPVNMIVRGQQAWLYMIAKPLGEPTTGIAQESMTPRFCKLSSSG